MEIGGAVDPFAPWLAIVAAPIAGSFVGLLVVRLPTGEPVVLGRSRCDSCARTLDPVELVPVLSWLAQRGRCRRCGQPISVFYPAVELAALGIAVWAVSVVPGWIGYASCLLGWCLLALTLIDFRHFWLPDVLTLPLVGVGLGVAWLISGAAITDHIIGVVAGYCIIQIIRRTYAKWRHREGLGGGDAKLIAAAGAWVSWQGLPSVLVYGCVLALGVVIGRRLICAAPLRSDEAIAFGPYLCCGIWLTWLYGPLTFAWTSLSW